MNRFEQELKNNNFMCSECLKCKHLVWPPSDFCNKCFGVVRWRPVSKNATLVEISKKGERHFCIGEFENSIRVFGTLEGRTDIVPGHPIRLKHCSYADMPIFVFQTD
jgi:uncharacterized OB-fold protein